MDPLHHPNDQPCQTDPKENSSKPVILIGYMASGKTTFGKALSEVVKRPFIDLDEYIESKAGLSISEIFEKFGEPYFREIERKALLEVLKTKGTIISCGGGTPCHYDNIDIINLHGISVFLDVSVEVLFNRIREEKDKRPLVKNKTKNNLKEFILTGLRQRLPFYERAHLKWNSNHLETSSQIEKNIREFIERNHFVFSDSFS